MSEDVDDIRPARPLRSGWTTGTCATAAAASAWQAWLTGAFADPVTVRLPRGQQATLTLSRAELMPEQATAGVIKDAGDDPDVTHGAEVIASVAPAFPASGVIFRAGEGIGTVTRPGLPIPPGEPAINPGPRAMITEALTAIAAANNAAADVQVTISIPGGAALAEKTLNGRLGIAGGLSVLGTTGIVVPFSCAAWLHSIHRGVDVARAMGFDHVAGATGSVSESAVQRLLGLPEPALIDMGDFAGGLLKYLRRHPVPRLTLAGGFAKLAKLAQGALFLHSSQSRVDVGRLLGLLAATGAPPPLLSEAVRCETAAQMLQVAGPHAPALANEVASAARDVAASVLAPAPVAVTVLIFDRAGRLIAGSDRPGL
jgi:cobalt-precorrin-5B (C1)-methyltransferase